MLGDFRSMFFRVKIQLKWNKNRFIQTVWLSGFFRHAVVRHHKYHRVHTRNGHEKCDTLSWRSSLDLRQFIATCLSSVGNSLFLPTFTIKNLNKFMYRQMYNRSMDPMGIGCRKAVFFVFFRRIARYPRHWLLCCFVANRGNPARTETRNQSDLQENTKNLSKLLGWSGTTNRGSFMLPGWVDKWRFRTGYLVYNGDENLPSNKMIVTSIHSTYYTSILEWHTNDIPLPSLEAQL